MRSWMRSDTPPTHTHQKHPGSHMWSLDQQLTAWFGKIMVPLLQEYIGGSKIWSFIVSLTSWCVSVCACMCLWVCVLPVCRQNVLVQLLTVFFPTNKFVLYEELKLVPCICQESSTTELYAGCSVSFCFTSKTGSTALNLAWAAQ